jgi:CheY-like chemotaxis protein
MSGWDLAAVVRARHPALPFALVTGWGATIDPEQARARGVLDVIGKPYRLADLQRLLESIGPLSGAALPSRNGRPDPSVNGRPGD